MALRLVVYQESGLYATKTDSPTARAMVHTVSAVPNLPLRLGEMVIVTLRPGHRAQMKQGWTPG